MFVQMTFPHNLLRQSLLVDLFNSKLNLISKASLDESASFIRSDVAYIADGVNFVKSVVGKVSNFIDVDSEIPDIRMRSEENLKKELSWASYLGIPAVSLRINREFNPNLARVLVHFVQMDYVPMKLWLIVPMSIGETITNGNHLNGVDEDYDSKHTTATHSLSPWHWWFNLSTMMVDIIDSVGLVLELTEDLPEDSVIDRWFGEPVVCLLVNTSLFLINRTGFPVLPKSHQSVIKRFLKLNIQILLTGACRHDKGYIVYQQYIMWLWKTINSVDSPEGPSFGMEDQLQEPLQPLRDNLSSTTYSIFESDPFKYKAYENAIYRALCDRSSDSKAQSNESIEKEDNCQVVMVLGAGRGPLVSATLNAAKNAQCRVRVYVIEKNPNALISLQSRMNNDWQGLDVHLIDGDMRNLNAPEKADIFVSELLGSFGDNELSPECLDGAQHMLKENGISIPCSYTSFVAPLQSLHFYNETKRSKDLTNRVGSVFETPYVVRLVNCNLLGQPQKAFTFEHPKKCLSEPNTRSVTCMFPVEVDSVIHGISGYFDAVLYKEITISIHPEHHSPQMYSWFPFVFPLDHPVYAKAGEQIMLHLWRCIDARYVWYEWALSQPQPTKIHNPGGHAFRIAH